MVVKKTPNVNELCMFNIKHYHIGGRVSLMSNLPSSMQLAYKGSLLISELPYFWLSLFRANARENYHLKASLGLNTEALSHRW